VPSRWSPDARLALVERLQTRSGDASESLFDAHNLGTAYRSAGAKNSKRARINAALHAARQRGDIDEILDAIARYLGDDPPEAKGVPPKVLDPNPGASPMRISKPLFLSHASADKALADLLRNTLVLGGVPEGQIFYSSDLASGIPSGEDVGTYLRQSLQGAGLVIELVSHTFLTRPMCLMELGGAWALGTSTYPIVVPPLTLDEAIKQIGNVQMGVLGSDTEIRGIFSELHDRLADNLGIQTRASTWNREVEAFRAQLQSKLTAIRVPAAAPPGASAASSERVAIANISVIPGPFGHEMHAEATNYDKVEHSATIKATFYDGDGRIVGTADALVNQLRAGATKTFSMSFVPDHARAKVEVDTIF
jgi:hypothetical protein